MRVRGRDAVLVMGNYTDIELGVERCVEITFEADQYDPLIVSQSLNIIAKANLIRLLHRCPDPRRNACLWLASSEGRIADIIVQHTQVRLAGPAILPTKTLVR